MRVKKAIATSLIVNFLGLNLAIAAEKPLPPLPGAEVNIHNHQTAPLATAQEDPNEIEGPIVQPESRYLKSGYDLTVELISELDSRTSRVGQVIGTKLLLPIDLNGKIVIPEGSIVVGEIKKLSKANNAGKNASMTVHFNHIEMANGYKIPISGRIKTVENDGVLTGGNYKKQLQKSLAMGATTTAGGALTGLGLGLLSSAAAIGSVVGLIIGGALGFGWLFFKKGKSINIPKNTKLLVNLEYDVAITGIGL